MIEFINTLRLSFNGKKSIKNVDSIWSMLHYRITSAMLFACFLLVTSHQHFGNPISCLTDIAGDKAVIPENVINAYCYMATTYSYVDSKGQFAYPGVGPDTLSPSSSTEVIRHAYYQWVPLVLLLQSFLFIIPHCLWVGYERGIIHKLTAALDDAVELNINNSCRKISAIAAYFNKSMGGHCALGTAWILTDFLALSITVANFYFVDVLLDGKFFIFGSQMIQNYFMGANGTQSEYFNLFPLVTKCNMNKYGPSGNIQNIDALCVMNLNLVNQKIYMVLWFWLLVLLPLTFVGILFKVESVAFLKYFPNSHWQSTVGVPTRIRSKDITICSAKMDYSDCVLFQLLASNMRPNTYKVFVHQLSLEISDMTNHIKLV